MQGAISEGRSVDQSSALLLRSAPHRPARLYEGLLSICHDTPGSHTVQGPCLFLPIGLHKSRPLDYEPILRAYT